MTIVAWDGKTLAFDSMLTDAGRAIICDKFWRTDKGIYSGCGLWTNMRKIVRELSNGRDADEDLYNKTYVVHLDVKGKLWLYEDNEPQRVKTFDAWGSGRDYALGALSMGATAKEAAQVACKHSTTCGGKIHTFTI